VAGINGNVLQCSIASPATQRAAFYATAASPSADMVLLTAAWVLGFHGSQAASCAASSPSLYCRYGAVDGRLGLGGFMALMKDNMLDAREVLAYLGARPESPTTTRAVIHVSVE
jgi:hypothetical protein